MCLISRFFWHLQLSKHSISRNFSAQREGWFVDNYLRGNRIAKNSLKGKLFFAWYLLLSLKVAKFFIPKDSKILTSSKMISWNVQLRYQQKLSYESQKQEIDFLCFSSITTFQNLTKIFIYVPSTPMSGTLRLMKRL